MDYFGQNPKIFKNRLYHRNQRKNPVRKWPLLFQKCLSFLRNDIFKILKIQFFWKSETICLNSIWNIYFENKIYKKAIQNISWFLIFEKAEFSKFSKCHFSRMTKIFGKVMVISWPDFYADFDCANGFWKFFDFDQNNPLSKFATFWATISVQVHSYGPKFDLMDSFGTLTKKK